jgi:hypothetical protein
MLDDAMAESIIEKLQTGTPPMMDWRAFSDWISVEHSVVHMWLHRAYIPSVKIGRRRMVNLVQLVEQLKEGAES